MAATAVLRCATKHLYLSASAATADGAAEHDAALAPCIALLLGHADHPLLQGALQTAQLAARFGGLRFRSTLADRHAAHWASWCVRGPKAAARVLLALQGLLADRHPPSAAAEHAAVDLRAAGDTVPDGEEATWRPDASCCSPYNREEPCDHLRGWQRRAAHACDERAFETQFSSISPASRTLLLSSRARTLLPTHDSACATAVVSASCAVPLSEHLPRLCREVGTRLTRNVRVSDARAGCPSHRGCVQVATPVACGATCNWRHARQPPQPGWPATHIGSRNPQSGPPQFDGFLRNFSLVGTFLAILVEWPFSAISDRKCSSRHRCGPGTHHKQCQTYPEPGWSRCCHVVVFGIEVSGRWAPEATTSYLSCRLVESVVLVGTRPRRRAGRRSPPAAAFPCMLSDAGRRAQGPIWMQQAEKITTKK